MLLPRYDIQGLIFQFLSSKKHIYHQGVNPLSKNISLNCLLIPELLILRQVFDLFLKIWESLYNFDTSDLSCIYYFEASEPKWINSVKKQNWVITSLSISTIKAIGFI